MCYEANSMTRNLFIAFPSIHQAAISSSLSSELFYTILEGLNPINPNRRLTATCFLHLDCTSFLQFPRQPRIHLFGWWVAGTEAHWAIGLEHQGLACGPQQSSPLYWSQGPPRNQRLHRENKIPCLLPRIAVTGGVVFWAEDKVFCSNEPFCHFYADILSLTQTQPLLLCPHVRLPSSGSRWQHVGQYPTFPTKCPSKKEMQLNIKFLK